MKIDLSNKELEILQVLWHSEKPLSAVDFISLSPSLKMSTVQAVLRILLKKSYIKVADIVQHHKVYARTYEPCLSEKEYLISQFNSSSVSTKAFFAALVPHEQDLNTLKELEDIITKQKIKLLEKE